MQIAPPSSSPSSSEASVVKDEDKIFGFYPEKVEDSSLSAISQLFKNDVLQKAAVKFSTEPVIESLTLEETPALSFFQKFISWWASPATSNTNSPPTTTEAENKPKPISSIPALEAPQHFSAHAESENLPPLSIKNQAKSSLSESQLIEGLSEMSALTLELLIMTILKGQMELEKENAKVAEGTFAKYQQYRKFQEKLLDDIKDVLAKDQKLSEIFKTAHNIAAAASFLCGIAAAAAAFGLLAAAPIAIQVVAGILGQIGPFTMPFVLGLTAASKAYIKRRSSENKAVYERMSHEEKITLNSIDQARQHLEQIFEGDNVFKDQLAQLLKRMRKMIKIVLART